MTARRVVVTGMGAVTPLGHDVPTLWSALTAGRSGIRRIAGFDASGIETQIAGEVQDFDPTKFFDRKEVRRADRFAQLAVAAATEAVADAKLESAPDRDRIGVSIATAGGGLQSVVDTANTMQERGPSRVSPFFVTMYIANAASGLVSLRWGFRGPSLTHVSACASSSHSVGEAAEAIRRGQVDVMVAGGAEAVIVPIAIAAFSNMRALSRRNDEPERASRPFDRDRDGFVLSEGAAVLVLEDADHAARRGAKSYGELIGYGASDDAYHMADPAPGGVGGALSMRAALANAGIAPEDVGYINAHGTSTPANDRAETQAIKEVFGEHAYKLMVSSTKSMTGHLFGAAGALEAIVCVLALRDGCIPPTINYETPDPELDLDYVPNRSRAAKVGIALSNSMGLGGTNGSLVFRAP
ncbi:MAG TPA: beta-ketoacyl-ACP synthase II [Candidatus Limnocylindria bacterium]|nr:beta-ketoacyl-ACP synthase II [Candidatus Limnocylindria bacterium]